MMNGFWLWIKPGISSKLTRCLRPQNGSFNSSATELVDMVVHPYNVPIDLLVFDHVGDQAGDDYFVVCPDDLLGELKVDFDILIPK